MPELIFLQGTTPDAFAKLVADQVKQELSAISQKAADEEKLLTREEASSFLSINLSTLFLWSKQGRIPSYKIANRIYYKKSELFIALKPVISNEII